MNSALKTALMAAGAGSSGAVAAQGLAHDGLDYAGEELNSLRGDLEALPPPVAQAVLGTVGGNMGPEARQLVMAALGGAPPEQVLAAAPGAPKEFKALVKSASELATGAPQVAAEAVRFGARMNDFEAQAQQRNLSTQEISAGVESGEADVSPLPAILGAAGLGTGGAILQHLMNRDDVKAREEFPEVFRVRRN